MMVKRLSVSLALVVSLVTLPALAQTRPKNGTAAALGPGVTTKRSAPDYGTSAYSVSSQWAGGMTVAYAPQTKFSIDNGSGFYYLTTGNDDMVGAFHVPSGVVIDYIGLETCDTVGGHYTMYLYDDGNNLINSFSTSAQASCGWQYNSSALGYNFDANQYHSLTIYVGQSASAPTDGTDGVRGLNIWWYRKVSPAPGSPTFTDVPMSDPGFQYIEALVASGVTAGCGGGNYCPDNTLTRRQMAVFISKALGLHWPD